MLKKRRSTDPQAKFTSPRGSFLTRSGLFRRWHKSKWAGDISYIWTSEGWLYLIVILDFYSRRVIGWAVSERMKRDLARRALDMAAALR